MFGSTLRAARVAAGLTQEALATLADTSRSTLAAYESGAKVPRIDTVERILAAVGQRLVVRPTIAWRTELNRGRPFMVPSELPSLPPPQANAMVQLPHHVAWSGRRAFDLSERRSRARAYEIVLREGTAEDIAAIVDGALLVDLWPDLVLPPAIRKAWQPLIGREAVA